MAETPPYKPGDQFVSFQLVGDRVAVFGNTVAGIERCGDGWRITSTIGQWHDVPNSGMSGEVVPIDDFLRHELKVKGQGYTVVESGRLLEPPAPEPLEARRPRREREIGGRDGVS